MRNQIANRKLQIANGFTLVELPAVSRRQRAAFTLVELLIVIGIIAILIGILIPVIGAVRKAAYAADSRNQIQVIGNAIDRYYTDYQAYPGLFSNAVIASPGKTVTCVNPVPPYPAAYGTVTRQLSNSENLVLSLMGSYVASTNTVTQTDIGRGSFTYGVTQKRLAAYLEATPATISMANSSLDQATAFGIGEPVPGLSTGVPEFIDRFPGSMPIIYIRARVGLTAQASAPYVASDTGTLQYDTREICVYTKGTWGTPNPPIDFNGNWDEYFRNTATNTEAKRQNTYILMSPGEDRKYGTSDDICNFSF